MLIFGADDPPKSLSSMFVRQGAIDLEADGLRPVDVGRDREDALGRSEDATIGQCLLQLLTLIVALARLDGHQTQWL